MTIQQALIVDDSYKVVILANLVNQSKAITIKQRQWCRGR